MVRRTTAKKEEELNKKPGRDVSPSPKRGGWDITKPGAERVSAHTKTQLQAEHRAKRIVRQEGGGEVRIHGRDGRIRDSDTVAPAHDPHPPIDKRH